jgi:NAD(P)H dehydrogenase (quinone)
MILVTGATGHFGNATINFLLEKGVQASKILALVRNQEAAEKFKQRGLGAVIADYDDFDALVNAFKGVEKMLFISGSDIMKRLVQHEQVIKAAQKAGVKHVVYTSFQRKDETATSPLWMVAQSHIQTEIWLKESGMAYTILKNNLYMDFLPGFIGEKVLETGVIYVPAANGKISAVLRAEMAEAAAQILVSDGHQGKAYDFTNEVAVSYEEMAQAISKVAGKEIKYISPSVEEYTNTLSSFGLPAEAIAIFSSFAVAQAKGELDVVSHDLQHLLRRKPLAVLDFISNLYAPKN